AELGKLRAAKGGVNSQAIALAIPQLTGSFKNAARDALAERLSRMTADTLQGKLKDDDPEIRRAAVLACAMKDEKSFVPDLIELLDDPEPSVSRAAMAALRALTNQHLSDADQWRKWWSSQSKP